MQEEIDRLKAQLSQANNSRDNGGSVLEKEKYEEMIVNLERAQQSSWEETERLSRLYEEERKANLENENKIRDVMNSVKEENVEVCLPWHRTNEYVDRDHYQALTTDIPAR